MKLKLDEQGNPVLQDGHPVYVYDDGREVAVDVPKMFNDIKRLNSESADRRKKNEALEEQLKAFEGIDDPEAARKAMETVANLDQSQLLTADKVEALKTQVAAAWEGKLAQTKAGYEAKIADNSKALDEKDKQIRTLLIKGGIASSAFLDKTVMTPGLAFAYFQHDFAVEDVNGELKAVAKVNGETLLSTQNPSEPADINEALETLINRHPEKDRLLKASGQLGGGTPPGGPTALKGVDWRSLPPTERLNAARAAGVKS